jgi:carbohydrate-binding DOMON domain-containing protein
MGLLKKVITYSQTHTHIHTYTQTPTNTHTHTCIQHIHKHKHINNTVLDKKDAATADKECEHGDQSVNLNGHYLKGYTVAKLRCL